MGEKKSSFEEQWQEAFENVEMTPSEGLWKDIDSKLTIQENGKYRRGFIFYRSLAAACFLCLIGLGYYVLRDSLAENNTMLGQQRENAEATTEPADLKDNKSGSLATEGSPSTGGVQNDTGLTMGAPSPDQEVAESGRSAGTLAQSGQLPGNKALPDTHNNTLPPNGSTTYSRPTEDQPVVAFASNTHQNGTDSEIGSVMQQYSEIPNYLLAYGPAHIQGNEPNQWLKATDRLYRVPQVVKKDESEERERSLFAGVNLATNYFDPNFNSGGGANFAAMDASPAVNRLESALAMDDYGTQANNNGLENRPQLSISYGVDVGMMLNKRLSLESGIDYGRMNSSTSTRLIAEDFTQGDRIPVLVSNAQEVQSYSSRTQFTPQEQQLTNSFDIISLPLKLGYNMRFNRLNVVLSSGVAANFFLNNRLSDRSGQLSTVNLSASSAGSPYRRLYYSAVVSGGLNYLLSEHYAVSVSPNYNFALSDLTQAGYNFSSQPNNFGIDFGIRYIFNK